SNSAENLWETRTTGAPVAQRFGTLNKSIFAGHRSIRLSRPAVGADPTGGSRLNSHPLPDWFDDAKFGIFIHWGAYSVPAYAPTDTGGHGGYNYAEWYGNYMNVVGSPFYDYHRATY